jgi:hypothetical protein
MEFWARHLHLASSKESAINSKVRKLRQRTAFIFHPNRIRSFLGSLWAEYEANGTQVYTKP